MRRFTLMLAALIAGGLLAGCGGSSSTSPVAGVSLNDADNLHGGVLPNPYHMPDVTLTDTEGRPFNVADDISAPVTLVFFGYTNCPDICSIVMSDIASARLRLSEEMQQKVDILLITSDPARDTPDVMRSYLDRFTPDSEGLTGPLPDIMKVANALGVPIEKGQKLSSGGYTVEHGGQVVGVLPDGTAPFVWGTSVSSAQLADDLVKILENRVTMPKESS